MILFPGWVMAGNFYAGVSPTNVFWPGGIVPYEFDTNMTPTEAQVYLEGVREWELAANIHFVPHTTETNWILFEYAPGTFIDHVDFYSVPEVVTISVLSRAQACHEMGHALGFTHENIRVDQANYLTVLSNNIDSPSDIVWFTIDPTSETNGPYDFESVMHLTDNFDSIDPANLYTQLANPPYARYQPRMGNLALSKGDRAAAAYLYGAGPLLTNIVTTTTDGGVGSLRAALYYAIDHPDTTIRFNIPTSDPGFSNGVFTISISGYLPPLETDGTIIDGSTQPGFAGDPVILLDGSQIIPEAYDPGTVTGLLIYAADCQLKNVSFQHFGWNGITLRYAEATKNTIAGCWFGVDPTGTNAAPNAYQGILIYDGASWNTIGGTNELSRNVLSGNSEYGIYITGTNTVGNSVLGNYIGTDASGTLSVSNGYGGVIVLNGATSTVIGGATPGARNVISGNVNFGLWIGAATNNTVEGNWIGLDSSGALALPNSFLGMYVIDGAQSNWIAGNIFSGNYSEGIRLTGAGTSANIVQGNWLGTDATGTNSIPNGFAGLTFFDGASGNLAGGTTAAERNVVSGNGGYGVVIGDSGTTRNVVEGNFLGVSTDGTNALANGTGVLISNGAQDNTLGGLTTGAGNVISGNYDSGILITDPGTSGNYFLGNFVGTSTNGVSPLANGYEGMDVVAGAQNNIIGGAVSGAGNVFSGNGTRGLLISDTNTSGNYFQGNNIGLAADGSSPLGNAWEGVIILNGAQDNVIGLAVDGSGVGNRIANNGYQGIRVDDTNTIGNTLRGNTIYNNSQLGIDLDGPTFYGVTPNDPGDGDVGPNNLQNYPVITAATVTGETTFLSGTFNSTPNRSFALDFYRNNTPDPSGYGQGQFYLGGTDLTTDGNGNAIFGFSAPGSFTNQFFCAISTDLTTGDTSEFGADLEAVAGSSPELAGPFSLNSSGFAFEAAILNSGREYRLQASTNLLSWVDLTNFIPSTTNLIYTDSSGTNFQRRFYRLVSP